ncbi:MAG: 2-oxo acid dehydrogenase subunit E2 [Candidatus Manganitrophus sp.]|nr:2-oxo acid dehydrogenase subunit E2 [Candidatus Manganitrophus sp.]
MSESSQKVAAVTFTDDADVTDLEKVRSKKKNLAEERGFKLTYLPFIIKAVVAGLERISLPECDLGRREGRDHFEKILQHRDCGRHAGRADGLRHQKERTRRASSIFRKRSPSLTEKAFSRVIDLSDLKGGTFTLTNYGVIGGIYGTPIINYPEVGILGLGKIEDKVVARSGEMVIRKILPLSLTFDHRVIYGAEAARFMNTVIQHLEDPDLMLIEGK